MEKSETIFLYGALAKEQTPYPLFTALSKHLIVQAYTLFQVTGDPALRKQAEQYVYRHIEDGDFVPRIDRTFPRSQIVEAHRYRESNQQIGKIVVTV